MDDLDKAVLTGSFLGAVWAHFHPEPSIITYALFAGAGAVSAYLLVGSLIPDLGYPIIGGAIGGAVGVIGTKMLVFNPVHTPDDDAKVFSE